ncbi:MAG: hypothetical protein KJN93_05235 [Alphaproteobacteria bacterium]|nr:hypothetical protein [Alphaproteobacteria bacterium]
MLKVTLTAGAIVLGLAAGAADAADGNVIDRIEDRRESDIERQTDNGWLDRIEDRIDRRQDIRDRKRLDTPRPIDRWARRSWGLIWGDRH